MGLGLLVVLHKRVRIQDSGHKHCVELCRASQGLKYLGAEQAASNLLGFIYSKEPFGVHILLPYLKRLAFLGAN